MFRRFFFVVRIYFYLFIRIYIRRYFLYEFNLVYLRGLGYGVGLGLRVFRRVWWLMGE